MNRIRIICVLLLILIMLGACKHKEPPVSTNETADSEPLFKLLSPARTNVTFANSIKEGLNTNILMYEYFYNGGGVATADFNGDGLIDIYFTSNMESNKLYINKGNFVFEDVTAQSGAGGRTGPWKTGVSYADVNGDGRIDLYICYSGTVDESKRANQLFINKGNDPSGVPQFEDGAEAYGLASVGFSNLGYFFDFDRDGDLDMLLINHNPESMPVLNEVSTRALLKEDDPLRGVRLFRQQSSKFVDVTGKSGISSSPLTYALGAGIADINADGWPDIYISNDYAIPDYLYINNGDGTFRDELTKLLGHTSHFSMGNDIADVNNDGYADIYTLDMLPEDNARQKLLMAPDNYAKFDLNVRSGFYYQYMRNMLHVNNRNGSFSEIGQLAGVSNTDWSWAALLADYNNDGFKDLFVTNGYLRDYTNLDFIKYVDDVVKRKGRLKREDVLEMVKNMPSSNVTNHIFSNKDGVRFENQTFHWGMATPSNSNGAAYADFDNDGDLDLVVNNINLPAFIFENQSPKQNFLRVKLQGEKGNTLGIGASITISCNGQRQFLYQMPARGYLSAVSHDLHFGLGGNMQVDSLHIKWNSGKERLLVNIPANTELALRESEASRVPPSETSDDSMILFAANSLVRYKHAQAPWNDFKRQPQLLKQLSHSGPVIAKGDVNNDGREDLYIGGGPGQAAELLLASVTGFSKRSIPAFVSDEGFADAAAVFVDVDNDNDPDLYVASGGYHQLAPDDPLLEDRLYLNDGAGNFVRAYHALPVMRTSKGCVAINDVNGDGYADIFVGGRVIPGRYPDIPSSFLLINQKNGRFKDEINFLVPELKKSYMITDALWIDLDNDNEKELVAVGEWMPISVFSKIGGKYVNATSNFISSELSGWWNKIVAGDFTRDGRMDLIIGNWGLNSQYTVTSDMPAELFYDDFDNNGSMDPILCTYIQGKRYPYLTRDEMLEQLGYLRSRFRDYKSYAPASLEEVFLPEQLRSARRLYANHLETTYLQSSSSGRLERVALPIEAQFAPVHGIVAGDFDGDGSEDVILTGNDSFAKLKIGKVDANNGVFLKGNGQGNFRYVPQPVSGLNLKGDIRNPFIVGNRVFFPEVGGGIHEYQFSTRASTLISSAVAK